MEKKTKALGGRRWGALLGLGLVGQLAWTIENMYLNLFVYNTILADAAVIADMVAASAVTAPPENARPCPLGCSPARGR